MTETEYQDLDPHNPTTEQKNQVADLIRELAENLAVKQDEGICKLIKYINFKHFMVTKI